MKVHKMLKMLFGVLIIVWMVVFGLRFGLGVIPLLLLIAVIVLLIDRATHRRSLPVSRKL